MKTKVKEATKIVFTKHNACWLIHMPDHKQISSEVLPIATSKTLETTSLHDAQQYVIAADIHENVITAHCLEIIERSVYDFEKRVTRSSVRKGKSSTDKQTNIPFSKEMPRVLPEKEWAGKQFASQNIPKAVHKQIVSDLPGFPKGLYAVCSGIHSTPKIIVPVSEQKKLALRTHLELIHQGPNGMSQQLSKNYYWPNMKNTIKEVYDSCKRCKKANVRRRQLISEFEKRSLQDLAGPRQSYGFDFYGIGGKQPGNILVIVGLCTREVTLRYAKNRDQKTVVNIIIDNIIFQKGVPLTFRSDNAPELVEGVVKELNTYLGINHVKTGGYNPRGNSICERVNATIGAMLRKCDDDHYNNIKTYLPAMQFAINTTYNSVLNCTPFEAGHGLPARTISQARTDANRIQFNAEEGRSGDDMNDVSSRFDESVVKKIMELAMIFSEHAKTQSEWHRRMASQN